MEISLAEISLAEISLTEISLTEISLMMQEDLYVSQLQQYSRVLIEYAKEKAFQYMFINFAQERETFESMSKILIDLISQQILSNQEIIVPKLCVIANENKSQRFTEWKALYKLLIKFYIYQFHGLFLFYNPHAYLKAIDAEDIIENDLEHLEISLEILEKNETALLIANSKQRFQQNSQKGLSWAKTII